MQECASIMNKGTANFPERFLEWSDEQGEIAYAYNFKLYMEKFLDTIPSFTALWWTKYLNELTNSLILQMCDSMSIIYQYCDYLLSLDHVTVCQGPGGEGYVKWG